MSTLILWSGYGLGFERKRKQLYFILGVVKGLEWFVRGTERERGREREWEGGSV